MSYSNSSELGGRAKILHDSVSQNNFFETVILFKTHPSLLSKLAPLPTSSAAVAFAPNASPATSTALNAEDRRAFLASAATVAAAAIVPLAANAVVDYEGIAELGGGATIDLNNANVRAYLRLRGMYPGAAGKIVTHGPYKNVGEVYNIPGLTAGEKDVIKKYESRFTTRAPAPEYVIDRINNGLYR